MAGQEQSDAPGPAGHGGQTGRRRKRAPIIGSALAAILLIGAGSYIAARGGTDDSPDRPAPSGGAMPPDLAHDSVVTAMVASPEGDLIATASGTTVNLWDPTTGEQLARLDHDEPVETVKVSPDGEVVGTTSDGKLTLWDTNRHETIGELPGTGVVVDFALGENTMAIIQSDRDSSSGEEGEAASASGRHVSLWELSTQERLEDLPVQGDPQRVAMAPDGQLLAVASGTDIELWETDSTARQGVLIHDRQVETLAFHPSGDTLVSITDRSLWFWDTNSQELAVTRSLTTDHGVPPPAFTPDGELMAVAGAAGVPAQLWDPITYEHLGEQPETRRATAVAFTARPDALAAASYSTVRFSSNADHRAAVGEADREPAPAPYQLVSELETDGDVSAMALSPDGDLLATAGIHGVELWDPATQELVGQVPVESSVQRMRFSPDGQILATVGVGPGVELWDPAAEERVAELPSRIAPFGMEFSPDGAYLATMSATTVAVWDVATGEQLAKVVEGTAAPGFGFSPDGLLVASGVEEIRFWDPEAQEEVAAVPHQPLMAVAFSPDGGTATTMAMDGSVQLWDLSTFEPTAELSGPSDPAPQGRVNLAFSPDSTMLVTGDPGDNGALRLWDTTSHEELTSLSCGCAANPVAFSPDGEVLVTSPHRNTGQVWLWDLSTNEHVATLSHEYDPAEADELGEDPLPSDGVPFPNFQVAMGPDGDRLMTLTQDYGSYGTVRIWGR